MCSVICANQRVVDYIEAHRTDFEPFMEDEEQFDSVRMLSITIARIMHLMLFNYA